jgi:hypothetical protein
METFFLMLVSEILLISLGSIVCFVLPEYYTPQNRKVIVSEGIFLAIACCIVFSVLTLNHKFYNFFQCKFLLRIAIYVYVFSTIIKIHSKLLDSVIAIHGVLKVMLYISYIIHILRFRSEYANIIYGIGNIWLGDAPLQLGISFLTVVITVILLIYLKYNGDYLAPDEIEECKPVKYCWQCGKPVGADENFCTNCGAKVE